jgi:hypothetical protein
MHVQIMRRIDRVKSYKVSSAGWEVLSVFQVWPGDCSFQSAVVTL